MGMTERLLMAWREAAAALDETVEGTPDWERAKLAVNNASLAYQLHVGKFLDDVSGHALDAGSPSDSTDRDQPADD